MRHIDPDHLSAHCDRPLGAARARGLHLIPRTRLALGALGFGACKKGPLPEEVPEDEAAEDEVTEDEVPNSTTPSPIRVVAFGDVHGDATAARSALKLASVIDDQDQ